MKQAIIKKGMVIGEEVPAPLVSKGSVLIKVVNSCISAGTEMLGVNLSSKSLIKRALEQPEKIQKVINMAISDGIAKTYKQFKGLLNAGKPTGYSLSGIIIGVGEGVKNFKVGDKVAAAGGGVANHAEYVDVPENLVVNIPEGLDYIKASSVTLGAIALQGIRRTDLKLGEYSMVMGCGVLGMLTIQMLKKSGIRVAASDINNKRLKIAKELGAEIVINPLEKDSVKQVNNWSDGYGVDAVIFTAATTSNEPLSMSFQMCRRKGKLILVGVSGMEIKREDIYTKELDFLISTSYGPGRYDKNYEEKNLDYPYAYVRWTENRNLKEYLRLLKDGSIKLDKIIDNIFPIDKVSAAFSSLKNPEKHPLMIILDYGKPAIDDLAIYSSHDRKININTIQVNKDLINIALVGTGNFATSVHLPNIHKLKNKYNLYAIMTKTGHKGKEIARQYNANYVTTNYNDILNDDNIDLVLICTRHDSHAELTLNALQKGKNVFVEKPLATNEDELERIKYFYKDGFNNKPLLMVGFNRRFSKYAREIKKYTDNRINPLFIHYRMNAGFIPLDHWIHESGGRIVGEACHIIDLMSYFIGSKIKIKSICYENLSPKTKKFSYNDNKSMILAYEDGSVATIEYFAVGSRLYPKEYMEIHFDEKTIILDDYKLLKGYGVKINELKTRTSQKGHFDELEILYKTLIEKNSLWPIEFWDMVQTTEISMMIN